MIVAVPGDAPVTVPDVGLANDATAVLLLLHRPPPGVDPSVSDDPWHTCGVPVIVVGSGFTVTVVDLVQPKPKEYVIVEVPGATAHTTPVDPTAAINALLLVHAPPVAVSDSVVHNPPKHICVSPVITDGAVFTVTTTVAVQPAEVV